MKSTVTRAGLVTAFTNVALAALFLLFAYAHYQTFARFQRPSVLLIVGMEALFAFFFLTRAPADATAFFPSAWASTIGGTFLPTFLRPGEASQDVLAGSAPAGGRDRVRDVRDPLAQPELRPPPRAPRRSRRRERIDG